MQEPRPALENLCCLNTQCKTYGQRGQANLRVRKILWGGSDSLSALSVLRRGIQRAQRHGVV